jgi:tetratricopeptide (TPR) repeat protein
MIKGGIMKRLLTVLMILGFSMFGFAQDDLEAPEEVVVDPVAELLEQADAAHEAKDYEQVMSLLKQAEALDNKNVDVIWKISRGYFDFADRKPNDVDYKKQFIYDGRDYAERALALDETSAGAHKWYAIHHGQIGEAEGTEQKIKNSYGMRDHTLLAIQYDPKDAGNYHVMGRWHYALSDLSWIERQVASIIYATPPEASFEEALKFFTKAHELDRDDLHNMLYIGYCHEELDNEDEAARWFNMVIGANTTSASDKGLQAEAKEALADL